MQLIFLFLFFMMSLLIFNKRYSAIPVVFYVIFDLSLNYINYSFDMLGNSSAFAFKAYPDVLLGVLFFSFLVRLPKSSPPLFLILILFISAIAGLVGLSQGNSLIDVYLDWRNVLQPILIFSLMASARLIDEDQLNKVVAICAISVCFFTIFALHEYFFYDGVVEKSWRYDFLLRASLLADPYFQERFVRYQIERGDTIRAAGLLASALQYSYIAAFASIYFFCRAVLSSFRSHKIFYYVLASYLFLGVLLSQVRASQIMVLMSFIYFFLNYQKVEDGRSYLIRNKISIFLIPFLYISLWFVLRYEVVSLDDSALGRIPQYFLALDLFAFFGSGLGSYKGMFDSFLIYGILTYGVLFFLIYFFFLLRMYSLSDSKHSSQNIIPLLCSVLVPSVIIIFSIQHTAGSTFFIVLCMTCFAWKLKIEK